MPWCPFSIDCPLTGGFFCWDLRIGVRVRLEGVRLWEVVETEFSKGMAGTSDWCPLTGSARLREVSTSGGSTVVSLTPVSHAQPTTLFLVPAEPFSLLVCAGPFTTSDSLAYEPLVDLMNAVQKDRPDVLVLVGEPSPIQWESFPNTFQEISWKTEGYRAHEWSRKTLSLRRSVSLTVSESLSQPASQPVNQ